MFTAGKKFSLRLWQLGLFLIVAAIITFTLTSILGFFAVAFLSPPIILVIFFLGIFCSATALLRKSNKTDWGRLTYANMGWMAAFASLVILGALGIAAAIFLAIPFILPAAIGVILFGVVGFYIAASPLFSRGANSLKIIIFLLIGGVLLLAASAVGLYIAAAPIVMVFTPIVVAVGLLLLLTLVHSIWENIAYRKDLNQFVNINKSYADLELLNSSSEIKKCVGKENKTLIEKLNELKEATMQEGKNSLVMKPGRVKAVGFNVVRIGHIRFLKNFLQGIDTKQLVSINLLEESMRPYWPAVLSFCSCDDMEETSLKLIHELGKFGLSIEAINKHFEKSLHYGYNSKSRNILFLFYKLLSVTSNKELGTSCDKKGGSSDVTNSNEFQFVDSSISQVYEPEPNVAKGESDEGAALQ